jgi:8-oxo-dGTP diphosphatase
MIFDDKYPDVARPATACFVLLKKGDSIAMILRKNTGWMDNHWGLPAGKGEWFEPFSLGATREALEESGVRIKPSDLRFVHMAHRHGEDVISNTFLDWVDVYFVADEWEGEPHNAEPEKSERLEWLDLTNLPENIVPPQHAALLEIAKGNFYSEYGWN